MTQLQFITLLAPGLGSFVLVILAWLQANKRLDDFRGDTNRQFDGMNRRFEQIDRRFEQIDRRFEQIDRRFEGIDGRLDGLTAQVAACASAEQVATLASDFRNFYGLEQKLEGRVDELSKRIA